MSDLRGRSLGHYRIVERLGAGGMGEVYRARDERLDRDVAVKVLPEAVAGDPERMRRFEREAKALAALNHPNIATVYGLESAPSDADSDAGQPFLVMELLEGESLREVISSGRLTAAKAVEYARAIADGLAAAHDRGIIHRDLKPENVFLTKDGRIKILDFGLAKLRQADSEAGTETPTASLETAEGAVMGTVPYMAPEQVRGEVADHRSDLFALGCVLYEMLSSRRPFGGATGAETAAAILKEDPEPLASAVPGVSPTLEVVVAKCLEKRPEDRFDSAHDLSLTLGALDTSASVPLPAQQASFVRRRWPHLLAVAIAAVIALVVILPPQGLFERANEQGERRPPRSIAILPLENLTGDPEQQYLVDGLHEELISTLARISAFDKVIARTSVIGFRTGKTPVSTIAQQLDVSLVIEGSVRRSENTVCISINLVDPVSESHLWGDTFERDLGDTIRLQGDMARAISREVQLVLTPGEESLLQRAVAVDAEAQDAYYRALFRLGRQTEEDFLKAIELLEYSLSIDRDFAPAYAGLAETFTLLAHWGARPPAVMEQARTAASRALEIDDRVASAHISLAVVLALIDREWQGAEKHLRKALEIEPNSAAAHTAYSKFLTQAGYSEQAVDEGLRAVELDPLDLYSHRTLGQAYYFCRRYGEAAAVFERVLEQRPDYAPALFSLLLTACATGDRHRAMDLQERLLQAPGWYWVSPEVIEELRRVRSEADFAAVVECRARQLQSLAHERYVSPSLVALVHATAGNGEEALKWLQRADSIRDPLLAWTYRYADFDFLRPDPRFRELVRRMNYPVEPI